MNKQLPSYERIFGEIDFQKGDEARSVYSPAAYLADLLQLLDDEFQKHQFDERRSDIKEILLDAKNTFEMLPYLDRVNEILASKIKNDGNGEAFEQIRNGVYPFNLPQDIDYATVKVYLQHLGVKAEELYRLLDEMPQQELLAKAYLGILEQEWATLIETARTGNAIAQCYGVADLSHLKDSARVDISVDEFIKATGISELELRELLFQNLNKNSEKLQDANFFCNSSQIGAADLTEDEQAIGWKIQDSISQDKQKIEFWLDRANRFIRLAKKTGFTFTELDIILRTCCNNQLNPEALTRIAVVHWLKAKLELEVDEVCALFAPMNILGQGNEEMPSDLFNRVYNNPCAIADKQYISNHANIPQQFYDLGLSKIEFTLDILDSSNDGYRKRVAHSLDLPTKQLTYLIKKFRSHFDNDQLWNTGDEERSMLTIFYRVSKLANICEISLEELFIIFDILEKDPAVRQFKNCHVLIDFQIDERDCYKIISQDNVEDSMWLIQVVYGLTQWMQKNDFYAHDLLKITSGDYVDKIDLKKIDDTMPVKKVKTQKEIEDQEKLALFNGWHQGFKALHFKESLLKEAGLDNRTSRLVYETLSVREYHLTKKEPRLISFDANLVKKAAFDAVNKIDTITQKDFLGLGIGEKIADKIYDNLIHKGYLDTQGRLIQDQLTSDVTEFHIDTEFTPIRSELFNQISQLHQDHHDVSIYPSDLNPLELEDFQSRELYENLIFNGYIDEEGALLEQSFFEDSDNEENFEVNANIGTQSKDVFEILSKRSQEIKLHKIAVNKGIFSELPLTDLEVDDLIENLKFNEYIDEDGHFVDNLKLTQLPLKDFSLALQFYPHRTAILSALKQHIEKNLSSYLQFSREDFLEVGENILARWCFQAVDYHFLEEGKIAEKHKAFFREEENSQNFDIWWSFEPTDNRVVFNTLRNIVLISDKHQLVDYPLDQQGFSSSEKEALFDLLISLEHITDDRKIPEDKLDYFLNIDNALAISLEGFEDYNKDVFFLLHAIAKEQSAMVNQVVGLVKTLAETQETFIYKQLKQTFNLNVDSMRVISAEMFKGSDHIASEWLLPLLKAEDILGNITTLPKEQRFNTAYRRTQQFALLANKLKLTKEDIELVFYDQSLVDKFPEKLELPQKSKQESTAITTFDALLESTDGKIYLFAGDRYWVYDGITYELEEEDGKELKELSVHFAGKTIDAAFVDNEGRNVIIAGGKYYQQSKDNKVWELKEREWGKLHNNFQNLDKIDAAYTDSSGYTYLFSEEEYVRQSKESDYIDEGYPKTIALHWKHEPGNEQLPKPFQESIDAAFVGHDGKTYLFKNDQFVSSEDLTKAESILAKWGRTQNNLKTTGKVDAAYIDGCQIMIFCGDQIFSFKDCLENDEVMPSEGFPKLIKEHFNNLPAEFHQDIDAAFNDNNQVVYLFKDKKYVTIDSSNSQITPHEIKEHWGKTLNPLTDGSVDAAFVGLDGKTYLFSGTQYFRYSSDDYSEVDAGYPRTIASDWGGLEEVNAAFVLDGKTYLFDKSPNEPRYIRYSTNDYKEQDQDYPRAVENNWWNLPQNLIDAGFAAVDAVFTDYNGNHYLFSGDQFIHSGDMHRWWSEPQTISDKWDDIPFTQLDAAFTGKDGKTYFFSGNEYVRFSDKEFCDLDNGYPRTTNKFWGNIKNTILETGKIDAAVRLHSEWEEEVKNSDTGNTETQKQSAIHTYLFSGQQFLRYTDDQYDHVDSGYPKLIKNSLADEPRFKQLKDDQQSLAFVEKLSAAFADQRNVYLFAEQQLRVVSKSTSKIYDNVSSDPTNQTDPTSAIHCAFLEDGSVYIESQKEGWEHSTSLEGVTWDRQKKEPEWFTKLPDHFKSGIDAVLKGTDGNTYLFKGNRVYNRLLDETRNIQQEWGRVANRIYESGQVDAGFVGRDGKTYLFSQDQFFTYDHDQPMDNPASELPEMIKDKWGGLTRVAYAYVLDGKTYLLEPPNEDGEFRYVCYSSNDYTKPDTENPIQADQSFWNIPQDYQEAGFDQVDALYVDGDNLILIHDGEFLEYNPQNDYWSYPKSLEQLWNGIAEDNHVIEELTTVFVDKTGAIHCFYPEFFLTITPDSTNPGSFADGDIHRTRYHWGLVENSLKEKVDAAVVDPLGITYLFSGDQYVRYSSDDYRQIDQGYPKSIAINLRKEASFTHLPDEFEEKIAEAQAKLAAVVINQRNVYLVIDTTLFVASMELAANYDLTKLACGEQPFLANGKIDAAVAYQDSSDNKSYTYLFSGNRFIRYSGDEYEYIDSGYPKTIASGLLDEPILPQSTFSTVPVELIDGIDAALKDKDGKIHLIKDRQVWVNDRNTQRQVTDTWLQTNNNFANLPSGTSIDAAIIDQEGGLLVFKGDQYIRYGSPLQKYVDPGYPKSIKNNWGNLPNDFETGIDAAFQFEGHSYFIKGDHYVRFINNSHECPKIIGPYQFKLRWGDWADYLISDIKAIAKFKQLNDTYASGDSTLTDILNPQQGYTKLPYFDLAELFDWDINQLKWLKQNNGFIQNHNSFENRFTIELILRIVDFFQVAHKISTEPKTLYSQLLVKLFVTKTQFNGGQQYPSHSNIVAAKEELNKLLTTTHCGATGVELLHNEIRDELNLLKRDALLPYAIHKDKDVNNARDLYQKLLIDVEMGSEASTSKIKEAIAAVQLFMHRYFINLEEAELTNPQGKRRQDLLKRWEWMKNYRVWEANRKVFLYPENYIRAELRDTKTPEFKALEQELLQGELNEANVTQAFNRFIDQYTELSQLKVAGGYLYDHPENPADKNIVLFGHTISEPRRYYYRSATFINGSSDSVNWQPWEEVNIQINSERLYPVYTLNLVYVFWAEIEQKSSLGSDTGVDISSDENNNTKVESNAVHESVLQIYYSYYDLNKTWVPAQKLNHQITSNDTITDYFIDFSGSEKSKAVNLDSIKVHCHYVTEKQIKPKLHPFGFAAKDAVIEAIKQASEEKKNSKVYLKATNTERLHLVNYEKDQKADNYSSYVKRILPGDEFEAPENQFQIVNSTLDPKSNHLISIKPNDDELHDLYLRHQGGGIKLHQKAEDNNSKEDSSFQIVKGLIGDGYTFASSFGYNIPFIYDYYDVLYFDDKGAMCMKDKDKLTQQEKRNATFQITSRRKEVSRFKFNPETRVVKTNDNSNSGSEGVNRSGIDTFKDLFPNEDVNKLEPPVRLHVPEKENSLTWVCFYYKGASFLCKPASGATDTYEKGSISTPDATFTMNAGFVANNQLYAFSKEGTYTTTTVPQSTETLNISSVNVTKDDWGKINNKIQQDNRVDAACVIEGKTYLFRDDQYVCYSNGYDGPVDEGYPKPTRDLTGWDSIDAAFQFGGKSYFIKGYQYTCYEDKTNKQPLSKLWPRRNTIDYALTKNSKLYLISGNQYIRYSGASLAKPDSGYPKPISQGLEEGIPIEDGINAGFTSADNKTYFFKDNQYFIWKDLQEGLVGHYPFNGNAKDVSGNGHDGTVHGATLTSGRFGNGNSAYQFDGINDYIELPYAPDLKLTNHSFTVSAWVKVNDNSLGSDLPILGTDEPNEQNKGLHLNIRDRKPYMGFFNNDTPGSTPIKSGNYYSCVTWRYDKNKKEQTIFLNGIYDARSVGRKPFHGTGKLNIGSWASKRYFNGKIDEVRIYDRALSDEEIKQLAGNPAGRKAINSTWGKVKDIKNNIQDRGVVDAAFTHGGKTYLFSGDKYYRYPEGTQFDSNEFYVEPGYPKLLSNNTDGLPKWNEPVRAVLKLDNKVYLFSQSQYAIYDPSSKATKQINTIQGNIVLPKGFDNFDAAFHHESHAYLVSGKNYVRVKEFVTKEKAKYDIIRLSSMTGSKLSQKLFAHGIDDLFSLQNQEIDELPMFTKEKVSGDSIIQVNQEKVETLPLHSHLEFRGANGLHYWELFFHAPLLIAQSMNTQQKFAEAKKWFEYIFDPTDEVEYWKFLPFLSVDIEALITRIKSYATALNQDATAVIGLLQPYEEEFEGQRELSSTERTNLENLPNRNEFTTLKATVDQLDQDNPNAKALAETLEMVIRLPIRYGFMVPDRTSSMPQIQAYLKDPFDPHAIARLRRIAYRRTTVMAYIDNLIDWGDQLFRQYTRESINEARMHYILAYDLLGQKPENTGTRLLSDSKPFGRDGNNAIEGIHDLGAEADSRQYDFLFDVSGDNRDQKSLTFAANIHSSVTQPYFYIPENQNLIDYWDRIEDRLYKIRHSLNIMGIKQPLPLFQPPIDPMALVRAVAGGGGIGGAIAGLSVAVPHYRFNFMLNKARELVGKLNQFGGDLLSAIEKKDSEALSLLQNRHEKEILEVTSRIKEAQLNEALENLKSLEENQKSAEGQLEHYNNLIAKELIAKERVQISNIEEAMLLDLINYGTQTVAAFAALAPDIAIGPPFASEATMGGSQVSSSLSTYSGAISSMTEYLSNKGEIAGIYAQYERSKEDWILQKAMSESEIKQLSAQIEGAKFQINVARLEIQSTEKEIKQNESMKRFMTSKFSNEQLYQWMTSKLSGLYFQTYKLAHDMAKSAEKAYQFERGLKESEVSFIGGMYWDSLRKGLLSGDSLGHDLDRMEKAYIDTNSRALEIGKHISLAELDPMAFIQLKTKGSCEFNLSEALFDYDFQGHYRRQVKTIAIAIEAGEGKTVNATLTQLRHKTVMEPDVKAVKYLLNPKGKEPMSIRSDWRTTQQIALGDIGEYDEPNGLFELRLDDERFLPFEGTGAVSTWRLELSGKRGSYNLNDLNKVTIKLKYTALNGGNSFASAVKGMLKPYPTATYFNLAEMFPNEWYAFVYGDTEDLNIKITREMLPNLSGSKITGLVPHYEMQGEGQVSLIMNDDDDLTLKHGKFNEANGLRFRSSGATWNFKAIGDKNSLSNLGLVVMYKAVV
ncbi:hemopexin repeat-containing protein [Moorena producens]|uniref:hemopexin repeat-containing protein n=1 Tax=Moorena producens TaxID=1155739 RepID=UPI003C70A59F